MATYQKQLESIGFRYDTLTANGYNMPMKVLSKHFIKPCSSLRAKEKKR